MRVRQNPWRRLRSVIKIAIIAGVVLVIGLGVWLYANRDRNPIPTDIRPALVFSPVIIPLDDDTYTTKDYSLTRDENNEQFLKFTIVSDGTEVVISQQTQPFEFIEIPEYKDRFLTNQVQQNEIIQTANGAIYLGQASRQNNAQLGVMLENGLIIFMFPNKPLDAAEWRRIGETLQVQKID